MATITGVLLPLARTCLSAVERFLDAKAEAFSQRSWM